MEDVEAIVKGLSDRSRHAVLAFAPAFSRSSSHGMAREWADVCGLAGPRRSYYNTIRPPGLQRSCGTSGRWSVRAPHPTRARRPHLSPIPN